METLQDHYLKILSAWGDSPLDEKEVKKILWGDAFEITYRFQKLPAEAHPGTGYFLTVQKLDNEWSAGYFNEKGAAYGEYSNDASERYIEFWTKKPDLKSALSYLDLCFHL